MKDRKKDRCTIESELPSSVMTATVGGDLGAHGGPFGGPAIAARQNGMSEPVRGCRSDG
jgi:hypothetical protein